MPVFICQGCGSEHSSWSGKCPHCGVSETIQLKQSADRMLERVIKGKYKIIRKLGQGGMGAVYLAEQLGIGHRVALKFLKSEFSEDAEIARRFLNEAKSYARVAHPNAVTLHDFGQDEEGNLFIAMEYCEGVDLKKILQEQKRIPLGEAIDIILQVADVLGNAHSKHVVHRDLKPENIMLRKGMRGLHVKVLDFGIARLMNEGTKLTMQGAIAGTPRYMAPEQVEGRDDVDHRADIYAVGILLYEMITGVQPFDGTTITEILRNQVVQPMPRLSYVSPELDNPEVEAVLQKACAKNRNERFPDMMAFAHQIAQAMPTQAGKPGTGVWAGMSNAVEPPTPRADSEPATMQATFVRSGTAIQHPGADNPLSTRLATPAPKVGAMSIGAISPSNSTIQEGSPGNQSEIIAPKSRTPMIAVGLLALLLIGGVGAYAMANRTTVDPALLVPPPVVKDPVVVKDPLPPDVKPPDVKPPDPNAVDEATNNRGRDALARAMAPFEVGNLDEAEIFLKSVPAGTESRPGADALQQKIEQIREKVKRGQGAVAVGNCESATASFREVLKLNPRIVPAQEGLTRCRNAALPPQLDP
jgi:serine/threonine protein kinase